MPGPAEEQEPRKPSGAGHKKGGNSPCGTTTVISHFANWIILMEMKSHDAAWPFLEPVNPQLVSGYQCEVKNPMDFSTTWEWLFRGGHTSSEEFAADALLVFDNCQTFNEDDSEVGKAGHITCCFFESCWDEFYQGKQVNLN